MSTIERKRPRDNPRMSQIVIHDGRVYLAGLVARGAPRAPGIRQREADACTGRMLPDWRLP